MRTWATRARAFRMPGPGHHFGDHDAGAIVHDAVNDTGAVVHDLGRLVDHRSHATGADVAFGMAPTAGQFALELARSSLRVPCAFRCVPLSPGCRVKV